MKKNKNTLKWEEVHDEASTLSKWMALYEAVNIIANKAQEKGTSPDKIVYKPKPIKNYIKATEDIFLKRILKESYNIDICYDEDYEESNTDFEYEKI